MANGVGARSGRKLNERGSKKKAPNEWRRAYYYLLDDAQQGDVIARGQFENWLLPSGKRVGDARKADLRVARAVFAAVAYGNTFLELFLEDGCSIESFYELGERLAFRPGRVKDDGGENGQDNGVQGAPAVAGSGEGRDH